MEYAIALLGQTAAIAPTIALSVNDTSLFLIAAYVVCSSAGFVGDTAQLFLSWTDQTGAQSAVANELQLDYTGNLVQALAPIRAINGTDITYSTAYSAAFSPAYDLILHIKTLAVI